MMIMIRSQVGSPVAEEEGEEVGGGVSGEVGERRGVQSKSMVQSTAPKASSRSRAGEAMNEECQQNHRRQHYFLIIVFFVSSIAALVRTLACPVERFIHVYIGLLVEGVSIAPSMGMPMSAQAM